MMVFCRDNTLGDNRPHPKERTSALKRPQPLVDFGALSVRWVQLFLTLDTGTGSQGGELTLTVGSSTLPGGERDVSATNEQELQRRVCSFQGGALVC